MIRVDYDLEPDDAPEKFALDRGFHTIGTSYVHLVHDGWVTPARVEYLATMADGTESVDYHLTLEKAITLAAAYENGPGTPRYRQAFAWVVTIAEERAGVTWIGDVGTHA